MGLTSPSQLRYLSYVDRMCNASADYFGRKHRILSKVVMTTMPHHETREHLPLVMIIEGNTGIIYDHAKSVGAQVQ